MPDGRVYVSRIDNARVARIGPAPGAVPDVDGDEVDDGCDCDATDATAFAVPAEVPRVRPSGSAPTLGWDPQRAEAGDGTTYVVVSGELSGGVPSACTLQTGLTEPSYTDPRPNPPIGDGFFYLVRAGNACGDGTFGDGTGPVDPRDALDAALPPTCP